MNYTTHTKKVKHIMIIGKLFVVSLLSRLEIIGPEKARI